jgi:hypothetical protein
VQQNSIEPDPAAEPSLLTSHRCSWDCTGAIKAIFHKDGVDVHVFYVLHVEYVEGGIVVSSRNEQKQNVTISLSKQVLKKARILAARRETSISGLLAH